MRLPRRSRRFGRVRRAVVDTNVWVAALLNRNGPPARLIHYWGLGQIEIVASKPLLAELEDVLLRPKIRVRSRLTLAEIHGFVTRVQRSAAIFPTPGLIHLCRDPKDDVVLETAIASDADTLITGDRDLRDTDLARFLKASAIQVLTPGQITAEFTFVVNYDRVRGIRSPGSRVNYGPRWATKETSVLGTIRSVSIEPSTSDSKAALWLTIEFVHEDDRFEDHLRLPPESGKLADFLADLRDAGIVVDAPTIWWG
ncbi:MAG: putative toxin-antitoxin system toxin component, PIN family [Dehalococcoidia bacterium]|nr:putative toxin-antitoxin system toxin component, PIN family [Dehalococcoidia bacterium]